MHKIITFDLAFHSTIHGECSESFDGDIDSAHELQFCSHSLIRV